MDKSNLRHGISAAGTSFALPRIFNFNGAKYNISTGGVLPAVRDYAGSTQNPGSDGVRLSFAGGQTVINTTILPDVSAAGSADWLGVQRNFSVYQQGLTAEVSCVPANESQYQLNLASNYSYFSAPSQGQNYYVWTWDSTANCNGSSPAVQQYVTLANSTNQPDEQGSGFLPSVVCQIFTPAPHSDCNGGVLQVLVFAFHCVRSHSPFDHCP
ncbi:hypothetical protein HYDPIDRAFT_44535, partial [Hydnomerulius pinastri MD-312]